METLINSIKKGDINNNIILKVYKPILRELTYTNGIILRENRINIPSTESVPGQGNLYQLVIDLAHAGQWREVKCKKSSLQQTLVSTDGDTMIEQKIQTWIRSQVTTYKHNWDPLQPISVPERLWKKVSTDFWGPLTDVNYIYVLID